MITLKSVSVTIICTSSTWILNYDYKGMTVILSTSMQTFAHIRTLLKWTLYKMELADFFSNLIFLSFFLTLVINLELIP